MDDAAAWKLIHGERAATADLLETLAPEQWAAASLCGTWTVQEAAGHIVSGAEQTPGNFVKGMVTNAFRFNRMIDRAALAAGALPPTQLISRLRATTTTTNKPPAPVITMLGEVVVHRGDICHPLGIPEVAGEPVLAACLEMYKGASFPVGTKKRIAGLRLSASDLDWTHGDGPEVTGPAASLLLAMTGRAAAAADLSGEGAGQLRARMSA